MTDRADLDAIADAMTSIVGAARDRDSPIGYFAAMYLGVTRVVRNGIDDGIFTTPDRLARLTSVFAQRYLDAWATHSTGGRPSACWRAAFDAAGSWRPTVLQHLLLGMNAHINLDLGVATAEVADGRSIDELRADFDQINGVLAGLVESIQAELDRVSPFYRFVNDVAGSADRAVINFSIARARAEAWKLAVFLADAGPDAAASRISEHDRIVALIAGRILAPGAWASSGLLLVRLTEWRRPSSIIDILSGVTAR